MIDRGRLHRVRNDVPIAAVIAALGRAGPPSKVRDGRFVFLCPGCGEMLASVNPRNNLAHCFGCSANLNAIDLVMVSGYDFAAAVAFLERLLTRPCPPRPTGDATPAAES